MTVGDLVLSDLESLVEHVFRLPGSFQPLDLLAGDEAAGNSAVVASHVPNTLKKGVPIRDVEIQITEEELKEIYIPEKAQAQTLSSGIRETINVIDGDSTMSQEPLSYSDDMTGSILRGFFKDGELDSMRLEGMSTTLYHIFEDSIYQAKNETSGDTIIISFKKCLIKYIFTLN